MNLSNFIEEYKISDVICDQFIQYHQKNKDYKSPGVIGKGQVVKEIKDSVDVYFHNGSRKPFILNFFQLLSKYVTEYHHKYGFQHSVEADPVHIIQYYKKKGGYFKLHYERDVLRKTTRQLAYMLYCNTLKNGGTEFPFQNKILKAIKGTLFIWPSDFTHPHRGVISDKEEKYIVTGWFNII